MKRNSKKLQEVKNEIVHKAKVTLFLQREDLVHPLIQGNKFYKLKYNLEAMREQGYKTLLTFGGAFSNHIHATAAAAKAFGFRSIGIIRGEECKPLNATLQFAVDCGMELLYVSRKEYRQKNTPAFYESLQKRFGQFYFLPEGGSNLLALKGCTEMVDHNGEEITDHEPVYICCPAGTGATLAGIIEGMQGKGNIIGFPALKGGEYLQEEINTMLNAYSGKNFTNYRLETRYHFGGFARVNKELIDFINAFKFQYGIQLDPIYTGKMMYGLLDMIQKGYFPPGSKIIAIHTGGLQGIAGINERYRNLPDINFEC